MDGSTKTICRVNMSPRILLNGAAYMTVIIREYKDTAASDWEQKLQFYRGLDEKNPVQIVNGRTLMPTRAIAEALGCMVDWDGTTNAVAINTVNAQITEPSGWQNEFVAFCDKNAPSQLEMTNKIVKEAQGSGSTGEPTDTPQSIRTPMPVASEKMHTVFDSNWNREFTYTYKNPTMPTTAPAVGSLPAKILIDESKGKTGWYGGNKWISNVYELYSEGLVGGCNWYADGRFWEVYGIPFPHFNDFKKSGVYLEAADKYDELIAIRNADDVRSYSIVVYGKGLYDNGHVAFVEYVERDAYGKLVNIYITEANFNSLTLDYRYGVDGAVQKYSMNEFLNRGKPVVGYIIPNPEFYK